MTRDRDLGDISPYESLKQDEWLSYEKFHIFYMSPGKTGASYMRRLLIDTPHDILYLNSFFDFQFTVKTLFMRRFGYPMNKQLILAPRGEFSPGALELKSVKKSVYIRLAKILGIYKNIIFQASSENEKRDIVNILGIASDLVKIAIDLPEKINENYFRESGLNENGFLSGALRIVFLSRISPKKNLDFALQVLQSIKNDVQFDIYGPKEDIEYWATCQRLIDKLPRNVNVRYCGAVTPSEVKSIFSSYDLFFFPTRGENYGHVIAESLSVGTPVLISDETPWRDLDTDSLGWDISLNNTGLFAEKISELAVTLPGVRASRRIAIREHTLRRLTNPEIIEANRALFYSLPFGNSRRLAS